MQNLYVVCGPGDVLLRDTAGGIMYFPTREDCKPYLYEGRLAESVAARQARLDGAFRCQ
jgi:hypothetical protein